LLEGGVGDIAEGTVRIKAADPLVGDACGGRITGGDVDLGQDPPRMGVVGGELHGELNAGSGLEWASHAEQETARGHGTQRSADTIQA
jgi:hypothetical protein